jgi:hypothetical protein
MFERVNSDLVILSIEVYTDFFEDEHKELRDDFGKKYFAVIWYFGVGIFFDINFSELL